MLADIDVQQKFNPEGGLLGGVGESADRRRIVCYATEADAGESKTEVYETHDSWPDGLVRQENVVSALPCGHLRFGDRRAFEFGDAELLLQAHQFRDFMCLDVRTQPVCT